MAEFTLQIDGMHCGACVRRVTQALGTVEGLQIEEVCVGTARLSASIEPAPIQQAVETLARIGFTAHTAI